MRIVTNPDEAFTAAMMERLTANGGYCPRSHALVPDMKCMCREFREAEKGPCHCGLYIKVEAEEAEHI